MADRSEAYLQGLNPPQREAVLYTESPLLILAGAGSGKTRTITHKIAYLIGRELYRPEQILAVTFTNKAADEMRCRVLSLLQQASEAPLVCTFHSLGVRILRRHAARIGFGADFTICDTEDQQRLLKRVYKEQGLTDTQLSMRKVRAVISQAKNKRWSPQQYFAASKDLDAELISRLYSDYQQELQRSNAMDFDDLLLWSVRLLEEHEEVRQSYSDRYRYLLVDEYQDTNPPQYDLIRLLTRGRQKISAVGDEDQSIYGFRGADLTNILNFEKDFKKARIIKLEQNYRSTQNILDAATAVVGRNISRKGKVLWTEKPGGDPIDLFIAEDARDEALFVSQKAYQYLQAGEKGLAVLYRTNFQSRHFEEAFRRLQIPYKLLGGLSFYARKEIRDALAYLRVLRNPADSVSLLRIINEPSRGIGQTTVDQLWKLTQQNQTSLWQALETSLDSNLFPSRRLSALERFHHLMRTLQKELFTDALYLALERILDRSGYLQFLQKEGTEEAQNRLLNLQELVNVARDYDNGEVGLQEFLDQAALYSETDELDEDAPVTLMTLHNAKGLEFPVVFLVGWEEGLFPHSRAMADPTELEEERRLCYVGLTRAQKKLLISYSMRRRFYGRDNQEINRPSRFLAEIPSHLVEASGHTYAARSGSLLFGPASSRSSAFRNQGRGEGRKSGAFKSEMSKLQAQVEELKHSSSRQGQRTIRAGCAVIHDRYGRGRVLEVQPSGDDLKITVQFPGLGIKKMLQRYAKLKLE